MASGDTHLRHRSRDAQQPCREHELPADMKEEAPVLGPVGHAVGGVWVLANACIMQVRALEPHNTISSQRMSC